MSITRKQREDIWRMVDSTQPQTKASGRWDGSTQVLISKLAGKWKPSGADVEFSQKRLQEGFFRETMKIHMDRGRRCLLSQTLWITEELILSGKRRNRGSGVGKNGICGITEVNFKANLEPTITVDKPARPPITNFPTGYAELMHNHGPGKVNLNENYWRSMLKLRASAYIETRRTLKKSKEDPQKIRYLWQIKIC